MPISQQGALNTTALIVPGVYVQIVPPQISLLNGVPTNILGVVGTAVWGPVNSPAVIGSMTQYAQLFGAIQNRKYDMGTAVAAATLQGAANFRCVRVTDGTDAAASAAVNGPAAAAAGQIAFTANPAASATITLGGTAVTFVASGATGNQVNIGAALANTLASLLAFLQGSADANLVKFTYAVSGNNLNLTAATPGAAGNALTVAAAVTGATVTAMAGGSAAVAGAILTAKYTGSLGNSVSVTVGTGTGSTPASPTYKVTLQLPNQQAEVFDNIGGTGAALFQNIVNAVNLGQSGLRGPSQLAVATIGTGTVAPALGGITMSGGADGAASVTGTSLLGQDTAPRAGMYALRGTGASVAMLADCDTPATWPAQIAYGLAEGTYMVMTGPAGDTIANAAAVKSASGVDSYAGKLLFGDWVYWLDPVNNVTRLVSPQGFAAGVLANLAPQGSSLNKPVYGIAGTQKSFNNSQYSAAELQTLGLAGIDVIANPAPGGSYFACAFGHNTSSSATLHGDNYTRMTNYLASTLAAGMGQYVGKLQTPAANDPTRRNAKATIDNFLSNMQSQNQIAAFQTVSDLTNNTPASIAQGQLNMGVRVTYLSVVEDFLINLEGGQSVQIQKQNTAPLAA